MRHRDRVLLQVIARHATDLASVQRVDMPSLAATMRQRLAAGESLDALLPHAFGAMCEAYRRTTGRGPGEVLILAGVALHRGAVTQLSSSEDVAVAAAFPALLRALDRGGVHVVTGPSAEARAVAEHVGPLLESFGLSLGVLEVHTTGAVPVAQRRAAYAADVTFGDYREFGYDYLRDNISYPNETVQRRMRCALVMEADAVLLGEAFTQLIVDAPGTAKDPTLSAARQTLAEITVRAMYRRYEHLAGTCADSDVDAARFSRLYGLPVLSILPDTTSEARRRIHRLLPHRGRHPLKAVAVRRRGAAVRGSDTRALQREQIVDEQRDEIYAMRQAIVTGTRPPQHTRTTLIELVDGLVAEHCPPTAPRPAWEPSRLIAALAELYPTQLDLGEVDAQTMDHTAIAALCRKNAEHAYQARVTEVGYDTFAELERLIAFNVIDRYWRAHLTKLSDLRRTIRARDWPSYLGLYRAGAKDAFRIVRETINREIILIIFHLKLEFEDVPSTPPADQLE